jgi:hypothetical protein
MVPPDRPTYIVAVLQDDTDTIADIERDNFGEVEE